MSEIIEKNEEIEFPLNEEIIIEILDLRSGYLKCLSARIKE